MAIESIGAIYSTKIPGYADNADVQVALRLYHYGSATYDTTNTNVANLVNPSIAYTLNNLQTQITAITPVDVNIIDAKGDLLIGSANNAVDNLTVGSNNYVLTADSTQTLGVKWAAPTNLTGPITSVGAATSIASQTGTGTKFVVDTNPVLIGPSLGVATGTSFNSITALSSTTPVMDGTAAIGSLTTVAKADHVHPSDTSRAPLASPTFTGTVTIPNGAVLGTPTSGTLTNTTGYTVGNLASAGTGVVTALGVAVTGSGGIVLGTGPTITLPVINNLKLGYATTATAAGTTTLTSASANQQFFTGTTTQTIVLPVTSTLVTGMSYRIVNNSTGTVTVQSSGLNTISTVASNASLIFTCIGTTLTTAADWDYDSTSSLAIGSITGLGTGIATALAVNTGTAGAPVINGGALGTPSSGTLTNASGLPIAGLVASTVTALGVGSIELGHATDTTIARVSAGVVSIEGNNILVSGGTLGTPSGGTLTNATGLPIAGLVASTATALGVGSIELGHATDTTIARVSAGVISVEGVTVDTISAANSLSNKTLVTPVITQATAAPTFTTNVYTLVVGDAGKFLLASNSTTAGTINIPTNASVAFAIGTQIHIMQTGTGQLTVTATTPGTTGILSNGATAASPKMRTAYSTATLLKTNTDTWYVFGDIV